MAVRQQQQKIQYEDFVPKSESEDQPEATILHIHLPSFTREQIRVTYVHATRTLRVAGERPLAPDEKRWNRFNEGFPVPENCHVDKIHGSFKNGVLSITMPKHTVSKVPQASKASTLPKEEKKAKPEEKKLLEESKGKEELGRLEEKKLQEESKPEEKKLLEESRGKQRLGRLEERKLEAESKHEEKKLLEESRGKQRLGRLEERKLEAESKPEEKKILEESKGKERIRAVEEKKLAEEARERQGKQRDTEKELVEEYNKGKERPAAEAKLEEKKLNVPELGYKRGCLVEKEKKGKGIMEKIRAKEMTSEEKRVMVNIGVAALVIFALGAYVSYTFSSSSSSSASSSASSSSKPE